MKGSNTKNVVLIADDDLFIRKVIAAALKDLAEIIEAKDGEQVAGLYSKHWPDIVFLDVHLPHISGLDLIKKLHKIDVGAHIIMMSSDSSTDNVMFTKYNGANGFMSKPFEKSRILHYFNTTPTVKLPDAC